jgi:exopolysaccharide biosynthesis WecB/TagA/CpsF family protein
MRGLDNIAVVSGLPFARDPFPANDSVPEVVVGGLRIARLSREGLAALMVRDCLAARRRIGTIAKTIFAANGHAIALAATDPGFRDMFADANLIHADGQAIVFASKLLTATPIPERSATTDFIIDAAAEAAEAGLSFYLLGGTEELNEQCASVLKARFPGLRIAGRRHGYFSPDEEDSICEDINDSGADVVWTGLSVPLEYEFATRNKHRLNVAWIVTCGGCFNFVTGAYKRAPLFLQKAGLEWLFRLMLEPRRLFLRYLVTNPIALAMLLMRTAAVGEGPPTVEVSSRPVPQRVAA